MTWNESVSLPFAMSGSAVGMNQNKTLMYIIGGFERQSDTQSNIVYQFDGINFTKICELPGNMYYAVFSGMSTTVNDAIYFFTGPPTNTEWNSMIIGLNTTSLSIGDTNISLPIAFDTVNGYPICLVSNHTHLFYLVHVDYSTPEDLIFAYNIQKMSWSSGDEFSPGPWYGPEDGQCIYYDRAIYIFGGFFNVEEHNNQLYTNHEIIMYDMVRDDWSYIANMTYSADDLMAIMPNNDGMMYIIGGSGNNVEEMPNVNIFDANTFSVSDGPSLNVARCQAMVGFIDNSIYVMGGYIDQNRNVQTKDTEKSSFMSPSQVPTRYPTNITLSPTKSPSKSPSMSPTVPSYSPTHFPTKSPTDILNVSLSEQQLILYGCGIIGIILLCCIILRCYMRKKKGHKHKSLSDKYDKMKGSVLDGSVHGAVAAFPNQCEGAVQRQIVDTFSENKDTLDKLVSVTSIPPKNLLNHVV